MIFFLILYSVIFEKAIQYDMDLKSNEPFWLIKNGLVSSYPSLHEDIRCDVLVVGSGITGSLVAHQCIQDGYDTVLIDKREIANGSSSATTSMLQYEIDTPLYELVEMIGEEGAIASYRACSEAIDRLREICTRIKSGSGFRKKDSLYFAGLKKDASWLKKEFEARKNAGFKVSWLEAGDILRRYDIHNTQGGILSRQGASVDAFLLVHELLAYNERKGLRIYDKTLLTTVDYTARAAIAKVQSGAEIKTKKIIYCIGYESASMIRETFVKLISTYAMVSEINHELCSRYRDLLIWNTDDPYIYMRTTDDHRMLIGGGDEEFRDPDRRDALITKKTEQLLRSFHKVKPEGNFYIDFAWAGTFGETKDGLPYIGTHQDFEHSYFVLGFGGNGITFSVTGMEMVSYWLKGKPHPLSRWFAFGR